MKYGVEIFFRAATGTWKYVSKRRFVAYAPSESVARVFAKAWADGEGLSVVSINVFDVQ